MFGGSIVSFIPLFIFLTKPEDYIMAGAFFLGLTIFCALALLKAIKHFKNKPTHIEHLANVFSQDVMVRLLSGARISLIHSIRKIYQTQVLGFVVLILVILLQFLLIYLSQTVVI